MTLFDDIQAKLLAQLPSALHPQIPQFVRLMIEAIQTHSQKDDSTLLIQQADLLPIAQALMAQQTVISFGSGNDMRAAHIDFSGDVAGHDIDKRTFEIHIHANQPPVDRDAVFTPPEPEPLPRMTRFVERREDLGSFAGTPPIEGLAIISGEPGLGKTTLAIHLAQQAIEQSQARVFWYTCQAGNGIAGLIQKLIEFVAWHGQDTLWRQLQSGSPMTGQLLSTRERVDHLMPLLRGQHFVLCLDDFQFLDHEDDADLTYVMRRLRDAVVTGTIGLIITSWRVPPIFKSVATFKPLSKLDIEAIGQLLAMYELSLTDEQCVRLTELTGGNAQLVTLAANALSDSLDPAMLIDELAVTGEIDAGSVAEFLSERVDGILTEEQREIMRALAVLQGSGTPEAIERVLAATKSVQAALRNLMMRNLLTTSTSLGSVVYGQTGTLQTYYSKQLAQDTLIIWQRRAGEYYAEGTRDALKAVQHFLAAQDYTQAATVATEQLWTIIYRGEVAALRPWLDRFTMRQITPELWLDACLAKGEIAALLGEVEQAQARYRETLTYSELSPATDAFQERKAHAYRGMALVHLLTGELVEAEDACRFGLALMAGMDRAHIETARLYMQLADILMQRSDFDGAEQACRTGLVVLEQLPHREREQVLLTQRLMTLDEQRGTLNTKAAIQALEQRLVLARAIGDLVLVAKILNNLASYLDYDAPTEKALEYYQESRSLYERIGDTAGWMDVLVNQGAAYQERGDVTAALAAYQECCNLSARFNLPRPEAFAHLNMGRLLYERGDEAEAQTVLEQAYAGYEGLGDEAGRADCLTVLGDVALARGNAEAALEHGREALALALRIHSQVLVYCAQRVSGEAQLVLGQIDDAAELLQQAQVGQQQVGDDFDAALMNKALAQLALAQGDIEMAAAHAAEALQIASDLDVPYLINVLEQLQTEIERQRDAAKHHAKEALM